MAKVQFSTKAEPLFQEALAAHRAGRFSEAQRLYRRSLEIEPDQLGARHNLASLLQGFGRLNDAQEIFLSILKQHPDQQASLYALSTVLLDMGDYDRGWPYYEARRALPGLNVSTPVLPFPEWQGEPPAGKRIVLFPERGLGDNIQFARFATVLRDAGAAVTLLTRPALTAVFQQSLDGVEVLSAEGNVDLGEPDYWALVGSLPARLKLRVETIPNKPYLRAAEPAPPRKPGPWRIGLATRGNPADANDAQRSMSPAQTARLNALKGVEMVSLHPEDSRARDFAETAQIIAGLDLIISVDTAVAHLAGAMGKRCVVLVPGYNVDWRWLRAKGGPTTPWYPTHRLFRSHGSGAWNDTLDQLVTQVAELTKAPPPPT